MLIPDSLVKTLYTSPYYLLKTTLKVKIHPNTTEELEQGTLVQYTSTTPTGFVVTSNKVNQPVEVEKSYMINYTEKVLPVLLLKTLSCKDSEGKAKMLKAGTFIYITEVSDNGLVTLKRPNDQQVYIVPINILHQKAQVVIPLMFTNK